MKNILVPVETHSSIESALRCAALLARRFNGHVEGVALGPDLPDLVAFDMPVSWTVTDQNAWRELTEEAHRRFETFMMENGVPAAGPGHSHGPTHSWAGDQSFGDSQVASYARVFDISVMGRPGPDRGDARMATAEAAIFESGRPVLLAPPRPPEPWSGCFPSSTNAACTPGPPPNSCRRWSASPPPSPCGCSPTHGQG